MMQDVSLHMCLSSSCELANEGNDITRATVVRHRCKWLFDCIKTLINQQIQGLYYQSYSRDN